MLYEPDLRVILRNWPEIRAGFLLTLEISLASYVSALALGLMTALAARSRARWLSFLFRSYMNVLRGTPEMVQIIWLFYVLPITFGFPLPPLETGIIALAVSSSAYLAEVYIAGFRSVPLGHIHAARSVGLSSSQTLFRITLPQAFRVMIPPLMSNYILLLKRTSLLMAIGLSEMLLVATRISSRTFRPLELLSTVAVIYLSLTLTLSMLSRRVERALSIHRV